MNIFISLTTVPDRLNNWNVAYRNLRSLVNQKTDKDYKVVLNLPYVYKNKNEEYKVSDELKKFAEDNPRLIINRIDNDRGPIEKVIGCFNLATDPQDIIIALDDDHVYHEDMLEYNLYKLSQYPEAAIGYRGDNPLDKREFIHNGVKKYIMLSTHFYFPVKHDTHAAIPGHWHSVTYKRRFFEDDFFTNPDYLSIAKSDDLIIAHYLRSKDREFMIVAYEKETNWIPVNHHAAGTGIYMPSASFPIAEQLPTPDGSGFTFFRRNDSNDPQNGYVREDFNKQWRWGVENVYIQKPFTKADEVQPPPPSPSPTPFVLLYPDGDIKTKDVTEFTPPTSPVVISLTTIPSRLKAEHETGFKQCLNSLLNQDYKGNYEIHFNIPKTLKSTGEEYIIPNWVKDAMIDSNGKLKIYRTEDFGPLTKLLPTVERVTDPNAIIVVVDDDLVYHHHMLEEQVINQYKFERASVGYDGIDLWRPVFGDGRDHFVTAVRKNIKVKVLQHYKTISYKRSYFESDFKQYVDEYYEWNDDILMAGYLGLKNIPRVVTYSERYTPDFATKEDWDRGNCAITFPVLSHTSHEGREGCTIYRLENRPHFKKNPYNADMIEKYIQ
jgi:hypothetical protein